MGTFDPVTIGEGGDNTKLYLASNNKLYWPNGAMSINAFRAYFQLADCVNASAFVLNFGDSETTNIIPVNGSRLMVLMRGTRSTVASSVASRHRKASTSITVRNM